MLLKKLRSPEESAVYWSARLSSPEFTEEDKAEFFEWLNSSPRNQEAYIEVEQLSLSAAKVIAQQSITQQPITQQPEEANQNKSGLWYGVILASVLLIVVSGLLFNISKEPQHYVLATNIGKQKEFLLEDGSIIWLNTDTELHIQETTAHIAAQLVKGEAIFEVKRNTRRVFDVITDDGVVRVLGTQFSVKHLTESTLVTVIDGEVALGEKSDNSNHKKNFVTHSIITNNQELTLKGAKAGETPNQVNVETKLAWKSKRLIYANEPLDAVVADLNRYYIRKIYISDESLKDIKVVATLSIGNDVETTAAKLEKALSLGNISKHAKRPIRVGEK